MSLALTGRLKAVSAGRDGVARVLLHARYGRARLDALRAESGRLHRAGSSTGPDAARTEREDLKEAAAESRRAACAAKIRLSEFDGTGAAARERRVAATHAAF